jgi:esterase/lipase superfamily enzyme
MLADTKILAEVLEEREIPAWVDIWGEDSDHDWPWWYAQINYFVRNLLEKRRGNAAKPTK